MTTEYRIQALAKYLCTPEEEIEQVGYDDCLFEVSPYRQYPSPSPKEAQQRATRLHTLLEDTRWAGLTWQEMLEIGEENRDLYVLYAAEHAAPSGGLQITDLSCKMAEGYWFPGSVTLHIVKTEVGIEGHEDKNLLYHILCGDEYDRWHAYAYRAAFNGEELDLERYEKESWTTSHGEYMVLTDEEADERAKAYIEDSLWAFNPWFLAGLTDMPDSIFEALQPQCESANEAILAIVERTCGLDKLVEDAISADGRGHFLNTYDDEENEVQLPQPQNAKEWESEYGNFYEDTDGYLYIYRVN